ncbi:MAG TPA: PHP domain-containing protein [Acidimicrobiales bacterium]
MSHAVNDAIAALVRVIYLMDRGLLTAQKVRAFGRAADIVARLEADELEARVEAGTLTELDGIGPSTSEVITQAVRGEPVTRIEKLEAETAIEPGVGGAIRERLRGDCHSHTVWSDGGATVETMSRAAQALGHEYLVITDHSPRLTVAHGLSRERLLAQLDEIDDVNQRLAPFRVLRGMEVDIFEDGSLDMDDDVLARLDVVVASAHSKLSMDAGAMTRRFVVAIANPHVDVIGHCTGRKLVGRGRSQSRFDAEVVFAAAKQFDTAVEINCRPERLDPPRRLLRLAAEWEVPLTISTDAHAPGQLEWQAYGCARAAECGIDPERIMNTRSVDDLLEWTAAHAA